jgi:hypothetical protein
MSDKDMQRNLALIPCQITTYPKSLNSYEGMNLII